MVWRTRSIEAFTAIEAATTEDALFAALVDYACGFGADLVSYHHINPSRPDRSLQDNRNFRQTGFPDHWVKTYREKRYYEHDPITGFTAYQTRPVRWSEVSKRITVTADQQDYLAALWSWLAPGDGIAVPCFGPSGRHGYVGIGSTRPLAHWEGVRLRLIQSVCESFHLRVCELRLAGLPQDFELTEREQEVLTLMARGHVDWMIAGLVGTSPERLETLIAGILEKMGILDRPSALLRAKGLGLVG